MGSPKQTWTHGIHPAESRAPLPTKHPVRGAERRFDKRGSKGAHKFRHVPPANGDLETNHDDGYRGISDVRVALDLVWGARCRELSRDTISFGRDMRETGDASTLEITTSRHRRVEAEGNNPRFACSRSSYVNCGSAAESRSMPSRTQSDALRANRFIA